MKLLVTNRIDAEKFAATQWGDPYAIISITDPNALLLKLDNPKCVGILRQSYWDMNSAFGQWTQVFEKNHAKEILEFAEQYKDLLIIINCEAGISRSAGVAAALSKIYNSTDEFYFNNRNLYVPNTRIYKIMLEEYHNREVIN